MYNTTNKENRLSIFEKLILIYFLIQPFFLKWAIDKSFIKYIQILIVYYYFVHLIKTKKIRKSTLLISGITILILIINLASNGFGKFYYKNLVVYGLGNILILTFFLLNIMGKSNELIKKLIKQFYIFANVYFVINIPILIKQLRHTYFMMRYFELNPMYEDHITGLIGSNGTHRLTFFWTILIISNIYMYNKNKKKILLIWIISQLCFMLYISSYNDNTAFFVIFPIIIMQFLILFIKKPTIIRITKNILLICVVAISIIVTFNSNQQLKDFYNDRVLEKYYQFTNQTYKCKKDIKEDEERIELFNYSLKYGNGYKFGTGIGSVTYGDKNMPDHFGMSEISIKTYEGGLIYLALLILLYTYYSYKIVISKSVNNIKYKKLIFIILLIDFILLSTYTQIFSTSELIIFWGISLCIFAMAYKEKFENKQEKTKKEMY